MGYVFPEEVVMVELPLGPGRGLELLDMGHIRGCRVHVLRHDRFGEQLQHTIPHCLWHRKMKA